MLSYIVLAVVLSGLFVLCLSILINYTLMQYTIDLHDKIFPESYDDLDKLKTFETKDTCKLYSVLGTGRRFSMVVCDKKRLISNMVLTFYIGPFVFCTKSYNVKYDIPE